MKKLLMVAILLGLGWGFPVITRAEAGFQLEKASLESRWSETSGAWKTVYQLDSGADWEWLKLGLNGKFNYPAVDGGSSNLKLDIDFPKLQDGLEFDTQYSWDSSYRILNTGVSYTQGFGEHWQAALKYKSEWRDGFTSNSSLYSRQIDQGSISLKVEYDPWKYQIKFLGQNNNYLNRPDDNCTQANLEQEIFWKPSKDFSISLYYHEMARNFLVDYPSNFWEAKYGFKGNWKAAELWHWNWDYYWLGREMDNRTEERQSFKLELESVLDKKNKLISQFSASDCFSDYDEEYEETVSEDDPKADLSAAIPSWKIAVRLAHRFYHGVLEIGYFHISEYDLEEEVFNLRDGIFATLSWEYGRMNLSLKAAPKGDLQYQKPYYEIKISFEL